MTVGLSYPWGAITAVTALAVSLIGAFTSLSVAHRQFKADVLSTNRQRWIDTFRDRLAELISVVNAAQVIKRGHVTDWRGGAGPVMENLTLLDKLEKSFMAIAQIQLLTKTAEPSHQALNEAIAAAVGLLQQDELHEGRLSDHLKEIVSLGRGIIRDEWGRVKRGE
ncbi:MAG: hypothetical protein JO111_16315 [Caulobacteraceae bacterium]|nr:hypothetical protein [Caulobacteraceae bacterium]